MPEQFIIRRARFRFDVDANTVWAPTSLRHTWQYPPLEAHHEICAADRARQTEHIYDEDSSRRDVMPASGIGGMRHIS